MVRRYQVPSKTLGNFHIDTDSVYTRTLCADAETSSQYDDNFGALASCDETPIATQTASGGIKLFAPGALTSNYRVYPVELSTVADGDGEEDSTGHAYVTVPWVNTWYEADVEDGVQTLSLAFTEGAESDAGDREGPVKIGISAVPPSKVIGLQETALCSLEDVREYANGPMRELIRATSAAVENDLDLVDSRLTACDAYLSVEIKALNKGVYLKTETSSKTEIEEALANAKSSLYNQISAELNNAWEPGKRTNPAYLTSETSSSSELDAAFAKKQDVVDIASSIEASSGESQLPTVKAVREFVSDAVAKEGATFQGSYPSWSSLPASGKAYLSVAEDADGPDKNDYVYVYLDAAAATSLSVLSQGTGTWRCAIAGDKWANASGRSNWKPQYRISDALFTAAQQAAIDSGITSDLVAEIASLRETVAKLSVLLAGMSRQTWTFEALAADGKPSQKTVLAQDL